MTKQGHILVGVKQVAKDQYAWPGGYPLMTLVQDGAVLCATCTKEHLGLIASATVHPGTDTQWEAIGQEVNWEDESLSCAHCHTFIECAYPTT